MAIKKIIRNEASCSRSNNNNGRGESVVADVGRGRSTCGYCKSGSHTSINYGLRVHSLTVDDYQALLDRGWRRCGCILYKPEMEKTCCPSYTIRLKANDFVPSKEHVRVAKRMQRFMDGTLNVKKPGECTSSVPGNILVENGVQKNSLEQMMHCLSNQIDSVVHACIEQGEFPIHIQFPKASVKSVTPAKRKLLAEGSQDLLYSSNISFQIAASLTRANKKPRFSKSTDNRTENSDQCRDPNPKHIADDMSSRLSKLMPALGLSVKACNGHINFYSAEIQARQLDVVVGKAAIPKDSSRDSSGKKHSLDFVGKFQAKGPNLEIRTKRSSFDPEEYALYKRYQVRVHNDAPDHVTESSYKCFLVDSPLVYVPSSRNSTTPCGFGSFHQQYLIDGKLVAVGVIDILPRCLSSKYFFWDPDLAFLSLGKYSALQEINWVRENQGRCPSLQYYYLGYYIHSCNKMRYKAAYRPSELLCPLRYQWVPFGIAKRLLDRKPYVVLSDFATLQHEESSSPDVLEERMEQQNEPCIEEVNDIPIDDDDDDDETSGLDFEDSNDEETISLVPAESRKDVSNIVVGLNEMHMRYKDIREAFGAKQRNYLESQLRRYLRAVGTDLSERMVYSLG